MKITITCNCGNEIELTSDYLGHLIMLNKKFKDADFPFSVDTPDIQLDGDLEDITDIDDIEATVSGIRINCKNCGDYIILEDF